MDGYVSDVLLALSVLAAPTIFCLLLYYGLTIKDRHRQCDAGPEDDDRDDARPARQPDREPGAKAKSA